MTILSLRAYSVRPWGAASLKLVEFVRWKMDTNSAVHTREKPKTRKLAFSAFCPAQMGKRLERRTGHDLYSAVLLDIAGAAQGANYSQLLLQAYSFCTQIYILIQITTVEPGRRSGQHLPSSLWCRECPYIHIGRDIGIREIWLSFQVSNSLLNGSNSVVWSAPLFTLHTQGESRYRQV